MEQLIVLCGLGRVGWRVLEYLQAANLPVVIIDTNCRSDDPRLRGVRFVSGDCRRREILETAGVAQARGVLILTSDDLLNISTTLMVRALNPDVRVVLRMFNQNLMGRLGQALRNVYALSTSMLTAPILAMTAMTGQGLGAFRLEHETDGRRQVAEMLLRPTSKFVGQTIASALDDLAVMVLAHLPSHGKANYLLDVDSHTRLGVGDRLVVCGEPRVLEPLLSDSEGSVSPHLRWASAVRRWTRIAWRALSGIDLPVLLTTLVVLVVVFASTLVLQFRVEKLTLAGALLRTLTIMSAGGNLHEEDYEDSGTQLFVGVLRISGAALMGLFTAIVTNYLLRARLGGVLEAARIPDSGHFIVCGLSPVGFRVVEELIAGGEQVVVIEVDPANRFVATVRRLKAAVIGGDATVSQVLRQARASEARAVVAATGKDLLNLEIALLVRELKSDQRVVLLMTDAQLAQMLRDEANVRLAVSVPALAAPAFVAGLYGDRVQSVFLVRDRLLAVIGLVVQESDALAGQTVRAVSEAYRLMPAAVVPANGPPRDPSATEPLMAGDRLVAIIWLPDLERLLRRQPAMKAV